MKCKKCGKEMELSFIDDTCSNGSEHDGGSYAFNLYSCHCCFTLAKQNVWEAPGILWVYADNTTELEKTDS